MKTQVTITQCRVLASQAPGSWERETDVSKKHFQVPLGLLFRPVPVAWSGRTLSFQLRKEGGLRLLLNSPPKDGGLHVSIGGDTRVLNQSTQAAMFNIGNVDEELKLEFDLPD